MSVAVKLDENLACAHVEITPSPEFVVPLRAVEVTSEYGRAVCRAHAGGAEAAIGPRMSSSRVGPAATVLLQFSNTAKLHR